MSRAPGVNAGVELPQPTPQYDAANERETRRLLMLALRRLADFSTVTGVPGNLGALAALVGAADNVPYFTGVGAMALASLTPYARTLIACASAAAAQTALGLGALATLNAVTEGYINLADVTTDNVSTTKHGFAPKLPGTSNTVLRGDGTYAQVAGADLALTDVTTNDVSTTKHGFAPKAPNDTTKFLRGDATWAVPAGGGGGLSFLTWPAANQPVSRSGWTLTALHTGGSTTTAMAMDSNATTRWATGATIVPNSDWFQVDTGVSQTLGGLYIDDSSFTGDTPTSGTIQTSPDGVTWTTVATWTTAANLSAGILTQSWTPAMARYVRLTANATANGASTNWWSIGEIYLYAGAPPAGGVGTPLTANETITGAPNKVLRLSGFVKKGSTADTLGIRVGADANNWYAWEWNASSQTVAIRKCVAGVTTDLVSNTTWDSDVLIHRFSFEIVTGTLGSDGVWLVFQVGQANVNTTQTVTMSVSDAALDFTTGLKHFYFDNGLFGTLRKVGYIVE